MITIGSRALTLRFLIAFDYVYLLLAMFRATAQVATYPLELLMARNAAYWNRVPRYTAYSTAFVDVFRSEGECFGRSNMNLYLFYFVFLNLLSRIFEFLYF